MKNLIIIILCFASFTSASQNSKVDFDGSKWQAPYKLIVPAGWSVERFLIPIDFAPEIHYEGVEDLRFTPGWGNVQSNEYWTYAFLWYLDSTQVMDEKIIENNLKEYYTGLVGRNIKPRSIPAEKVIPVKTSFKKTTTSEGDLQTYSGEVYMLDYMEQKTITLNCIVHLRSCNGENKTFVFNEISPKPFTDEIWKTLNQLWSDFKCK